MADLVYSSDHLTPTQPNNVNEVKSIKTETAAYVNGADWVDTNRIAPGAVTDTELASPNNSAYRNLLHASTLLENSSGGSIPAGTYFMEGLGFRVASGNNTFINIPATPVSLPTSIPLIYLDDADYAVAGKTQKVRIRACVSTNATVPAVTITVGLYPVTFTGGSNLLVATLGTVVTGSTASFTSPSASASTTAVSTDVTVPADGAYTIGFVTSTTLTTNAALQLTAMLQTRSV